MSGAALTCVVVCIWEERHSIKVLTASTLNEIYMYTL